MHAALPPVLILPDGQSTQGALPLAEYVPAEHVVGRWSTGTSLTLEHEFIAHLPCISEQNIGGKDLGLTVLLNASGQVSLLAPYKFKLRAPAPLPALPVWQVKVE